MNDETNELIEIDHDAVLDINLICGTWLPGLYYGNDWFREIDPDVYFEKYKTVIHQILSRPKIKISAARLKADPDTVLAYCVYEPNVIHWIYCKPAFRKLGIAKALVPSDTLAVTHLTKIGRSIKPEAWIFDPFI